MFLDVSTNKNIITADAVAKDIRGFLIKQLGELDKMGFEGVVNINFEIETVPNTSGKKNGINLEINKNSKPELKHRENTAASSTEPTEKDTAELINFINFMANMLETESDKKEVNKPKFEHICCETCPELETCSNGKCNLTEAEDTFIDDICNIFKNEIDKINSETSSETSSETCEKESIEKVPATDDTVEETTEKPKKALPSKKKLINGILNELINENITSDKTAIKKYAGIVCDIIMLGTDGQLLIDKDTKKKLAKKNQYAVDSFSRVLSKLVGQGILCKPSTNVYAVNPTFFERVVC